MSLCLEMMSYYYFTTRVVEGDTITVFMIITVVCVQENLSYLLHSLVKSAQTLGFVVVILRCKLNELIGTDKLHHSTKQVSVIVV